MEEQKRGLVEEKIRVQRRSRGGVQWTSKGRFRGGAEEGFSGGEDKGLEEQPRRGSRDL